MSEKRPPRRQCKSCPWKKDADPYQIPRYDIRLHKELSSTIARRNSCEGLLGPIQKFACHETPTDGERPCVGWLMNQLGPGGNIPLRIRVLYGTIDANVETVGPQHERFEDTLPRQRRRRS